MEDIKPVVEEKRDFDYRDDSILIALFAVFRRLYSDTRIQIDNYSMDWFAIK